MTKEDIELFIKERKEVFNYSGRELLSNSKNKEISTDVCKVLYLNVGLNPSQNYYGQMVGAFVYLPTDEIYTFEYFIHRPKQKSPALSNKMKNIYKVTKKHLNNDFYYFDENTTNFGQRAFWLSTPLNTLKNEDYDLRVFMNKLTEYSRKHDFCKQLRKTDKTRLEYLKECPSNFKRIDI